MNRKLFVTLLLGVCLVWVSAGSAAGQAPTQDPLPAEAASPDAIVGSQLTYQGWYTESGIPVNGRRDMAFRVHTNSTCTAAVGSNIARPGVNIEDGVFEVLLDVRHEDFNGQALWLKVTVGGVDLGCLSLLPAPYALSLRPGARISDDYTTAQLNRSWTTGTVSSKAAIYGRVSGAGSPGSLRYGVYGVSDSPGGAGVYALGNGEQDPDLILGGRDDANDNGVIWSDPHFPGSDIFIRSHDEVGIHLNRDGDDADLGHLYVYNGDGSTILQLDESGFLQVTNGEGEQTLEVDSAGTATVSVLRITGGSDLSERFDVSSSRGEIKPGMVVCIDVARPGQLVVCEKAYDRTVAGIISGAGGISPGMVMGQEGSPADGAHPVTLTGRAYALADASTGVIQPGDLLTTSAKPGHVMRVTDYAPAVGAIIGKAMTSLSQGTGQILVLVGLQ